MEPTSKGIYEIFLLQIMFLYYGFGLISFSLKKEVLNLMVIKLLLNYNLSNFVSLND